MKSATARILRHLAFPFALLTARLAAADPVVVSYAPSDPAIRYEGRIDFTQPDEPVLIWQGTRVTFAFAGGGLALRFHHGTGTNYFNADVDGRTTLLTVLPGASRVEIAVSGAGEHRVTLFKRNEAASGHVALSALEFSADSRLLPATLPAYRMRMEFFGDSITAGACDEDGAEDQWSDRSTHNNALSYSTLTAASFRADYRCVAVSGMGVAAGWVEMKAGRVWDRLYPDPDAPAADLKSWQPDVAFLNLGENDDSYPRAHGQPFPADYTANYISLVKAFRAAYPRAHVVLLRGGMWGGAQSEPLRAAWEAAVKEIEAGDSNVSHFVFTHWSHTHPRVSDHRAMADELIAWLKTQPFMARYR